jgi:hypothetical protein
LIVRALLFEREIALKKPAPRGGFVATGKGRGVVATGNTTSTLSLY